MLETLSEVTECLMNSEKVIEQVGQRVTADLLGAGYSFLVLHIQPEQEVCFMAVTENDFGRKALNLSKREGKITAEMMGMSMEEVFYHEDFAADGCLVELEKGKEYQMADEELKLGGLSFCLCGHVTMEDVLKLPDGSYLMINCDEALDKIHHMETVRETADLRSK